MFAHECRAVIGCDSNRRLRQAEPGSRPRCFTYICKVCKGVTTDARTQYSWYPFFFYVFVCVHSFNYAARPAATPGNYRHQVCARPPFGGTYVVLRLTYASAGGRMVGTASFLYSQECVEGLLPQTCSHHTFQETMQQRENVCFHKLEKLMGEDLKRQFPNDLTYKS